MEWVYLLRTIDGHADKHWHQECFPQHLLTSPRFGQCKYLENSYAAKTYRCERCQQLVCQPKQVRNHA